MKKILLIITLILSLTTIPLHSYAQSTNLKNFEERLEDYYTEETGNILKYLNSKLPYWISYIKEENTFEVVSKIAISDDVQETFKYTVEHDISFFAQETYNFKLFDNGNLDEPIIVMQNTVISEENKNSIKNDGPEYTEESNAAFATYYMNQLNAFWLENSLPGYISVKYYDKNLVYVYLPQDFKYLPNSDLQKMSDILYQAKEAFFSEWAIENGYDLGFTTSPVLYVKSEDDTTLAEESGILNKSMKLKINNN